MIIYKALLKHGYSNFKLEILEYCGINNLLAQEQYYIDLLRPEYNILSIAGSSIGYRHSEECLAKLKEHLSKLNSEKSIKVEVKDIETDTTTIYDSIRKAAIALKTTKNSILYQETRKSVNKPFKKRYFVKILRD